MIRKSSNRQREAPNERIGPVGPVSDIAITKPDDAARLVFAFPEPHSQDTSVQTTFADFTQEDIRLKLNSIGSLAPFATLRTVPPVHEATTKTYDQAAIGTCSDEEILDTLIQSAQGNQGTFFSGSLDQIACDFTRLPSNQIAVTELPSDTLDALVSHLASWTEAGSNNGGPIQPGSIVVETALRALLRYHLVTLNFDSTLEYREDQDSATAILAINSNGFAIGLWSPCRGLVRELGEPFRVTEYDSDQEHQPPTEAALRANADHAIGRLVGFIRDATSVYQFQNVDSVLLSASDQISEIVSEKLNRYASAARKQLSETPVPLEQAVAWGLALGADPQGPLPAINLAVDLRSRLTAIQQNKEAELVAGNQHRRASAFFLLLFLPVLAAGIVIGMYAHASVRNGQLLHIHEAEVREEARLKTIQTERRSATENILWFQTVVSQIIDRRSRQGGIIRLFDDLEARWPSDDPTFYVRELTVKQDGNIEMKGLTKREESVIAFGRSLEFSSGIFQNIAPTINSTPTGLEGGPQNSIASASQAPPGVIAWTLKGIYVPLKSTNAAPPAPSSAPGGAK